MQIERYKKRGGGINCEQQIQVVTLLGRERRKISSSPRFKAVFTCSFQVHSRLLYGLPPFRSLFRPLIDKYSGETVRRRRWCIFSALWPWLKLPPLSPRGVSLPPSLLLRRPLPPSGLKLCLMSLRISWFLPPLYAKGTPLGWWWYLPLEKIRRKNIYF